MKTARWYFDFISPYSYLQHTVLTRFEGLVQIEPVPILFAGLLEHHGQKGPAEIAGKRTFTYEHVAWLAERNGIALRFPASHPFNPLPLLRQAHDLPPGHQLALAPPQSRSLRKLQELRQRLVLAELLMDAALFRKESRGGHYRLDMPCSQPFWCRHTVQRRGMGLFTRAVGPDRPDGT